MVDFLSEITNQFDWIVILASIFTVFVVSWYLYVRSRNTNLEKELRYYISRSDNDREKYLFDVQI